ncbi:MAG: MFS transporter [Planctomycetes bacterium]|nr:MFS transporter [Planctomycetota bacterium]
MAETNTTLTPDLVSKQALDPVLRMKLSLMMFLQYAVWGIWAPILGIHLGSLPAFQLPGGGPNLARIGLIYMTMPIASIIGPFIGGQIADRYFAAQRFLGVSQLLGGALLLVVGRLTGFAEVFVGMLLYNLLYAPTIALTNSISLQHWPNEQFSKIRVWGSIGWIVIGWVFGFWVAKLDRPMGDCLYLAAALSFLHGLLSFAMPHTPPAKQAANPWAFLDAVGMLRNRAFAVMAIVSFFVAIELQFYFIWTQTFLNKGVGIQESWVGRVLTAGQICEMVMMVLLPVVLAKCGFRIAMALGIAAWGLRDLAFAVGQPIPLVVGAVALHGVGFAFFFTTIFMFADAVAPKDIKSSAQSFLASVTIGCGMLIGSLLAGPVVSACQGDWHKVYLVPAILCAVCCVVFLMGFRDNRESAAP